jgi:hypothetical protein
VRKNESLTLLKLLASLAKSWTYRGASNQEKMSLHVSVSLLESM